MIASIPPTASNPVKRSRVLFGLALLYTTQGIPFGLASEYLPVVLRMSGASLAVIAAVSWLQLPWQAKVLWAGVADRPSIRARSRGILLGLQLGLAVVVAGYALAPFAHARTLWFALTALAALFAATQDVFVDALAVRALRAEDRGVGNVAQVAGYRVGILVGGAGLLLVIADLGARPTLLLLAALVASASLAAFGLREQPHVYEGEPTSARASPPASGAVEPLAARALLDRVFSREAWPVIALACTYKLGLHIASVLIKPMVVDAHWTQREIGLAVVTAGTAAGLVGAGLGGVFHRALGDARALLGAGLVQALTCVPLVLTAFAGVPRGLAIFSIACEHFASGVGTTVLFAALMSATRPANAGLHYTILTSANALAIGLGGVLGGALGDRVGFGGTFAVACLVSLAPLLLVARWRTAAVASAGVFD